MFRLQTQAEVQCQPHVALAIEFGAERVLVIIASDTPPLGNRDVFVRHVVAVGVSQTSQLRTLHGVERIADLDQSERFMQCRCESVVGDLARWIVVDTAHEPDFTLTNGNRDSAIFKSGDPTDFQRQSFGSGLPEL